MPLKRGNVSGNYQILTLRINSIKLKLQRKNLSVLRSIRISLVSKNSIHDSNLRQFSSPIDFPWLSCCFEYSNLGSKAILPFMSIEPIHGISQKQQWFWKRDTLLILRLIFRNSLDFFQISVLESLLVF